MEAPTGGARTRKGLGRKGRVALAVVVSTVLWAAAIAGGAFYKLNHDISSSEHAQLLMTAGKGPAVQTTAPAPAQVPEDFYVLLLGADADDARRDGEEAKQFEKEQGGTFRSDSITVAHVNTTTKNVSLCSFDRDLKSVIQGYEDDGYYKLNKAYELGGTELMKAEVEELIGRKIDYTMVVDMGQLDAVIDAIGGIDVDIEEAFWDEQLEDGFEEAGVQHLDGAKAVMYCRARHAFDEGTKARTRHQRQVLQAIGKKITSSDPMELYAAACAISENVASDMPLTQMVEVASRLVGMDWGEHMHKYEMPTEGCLDGEVWFAFLGREGWQRTLLAMENNDGAEVTDEDVEEHGEVKLHTDVVFADESEYFPDFQG